MLANTAAGCGTGNTCTGGNCATAHAEAPPGGVGVDNDFVQTYVDIDGDASTFMSSSDSLNLPSCSTISFAGLYWGAGGAIGEANGTHWATRANVKLKVNAGVYLNLTADATFDNNTGYKSYHNFKDITSIVSAAGRKGRYTVANMPLLNDAGGTSNRWGGWAIVVVYKNDLANFRNLTVFDGLTNVDNTDPITDLTVSGFFTPPTGPVSFELGLVTYDGDRGAAASGGCSTSYKGDSLLFNGAGAFVPISDAIHPMNDVFNSTISNNGVLTPYRNPNYNNTLGHDANILFPNNASKNYIGNSATSAIIRQKTGGETYLTQVVTSAIDIYEPDLRGGLRVKDLNGGTVVPGDTLEYTMVVKNIGSDPSVNTYVVDSIASNLVYVPGTIKITYGPNTGPKTDVTLDDQGEYNAALRYVKVRVGTGANATTGGTVLNSPTGVDSTQIKFRVVVSTDCIVLGCYNVVQNQFQAFATGQISGNTFSHGSNPDILDAFGCPVVGSTNTNIGSISCPPPVATSNAPLCSGSTLNLNATSSSISGYSWTGPGGFTSTSQNPSIINATPVMSGTYTVTIHPPGGSCTFTATTVVTVAATPTVNPIANRVLCNGSNSTVISFSGSIAGATFGWTNSSTAIGLAATGTGNLPSFTATNATSSPIIATITVTPNNGGCLGTPISFTITVNPTPSVSSIPNQTLCNGSNTSPITMTGPVAGTVFSWTNSDPSIGLAASGTGSIGSFVATNLTSSPVTAIIQVTPAANGCSGPIVSFSIRVNPTPNTSAVSNQIVCNGSSTSPINFTGTVPGTTFSWTNDTPSIGLAAGGSGNIGSFTAINNTSAPVLAIINVTPSANGCAGPAVIFTIRVNPTPDVNSVSNQTVCNGDATLPINFASSVSGTSFNWTNSAPSIGLAASGSGNISAFFANNTSALPITATITVTPTVFGCTGIPITFTITANPSPVIASISNQTVCNGSNTSAINFSSPVSGATFSWTNSNSSIGLAASGSGNISSFVATNAGASPITSTITVTASSLGCSGNSTSFTITVNPSPQNTNPNTATICSGGTLGISLTAAVSSTFTWIAANNPNTTGESTTSQTSNFINNTIVNTSTATQTVIYTVTPTSALGCVGPDQIITITVNPRPNVTSISADTICSGSTVNIALTSDTPPATFTWVAADNSNTTGESTTVQTTSTISNTITNTSVIPQTVVYTVTPTATAGGCPGNPQTLNVLVNPIPVLSGIPDQIVCNGYNTSLVTLSTFVSGTTFSWTNDTPSIGLAASGTGNVPSFSAFNTGPGSVTATITVVPSANGCGGTPVIFHITVNPTSDVVSAPNQTLCNGDMTAPITFNGSISGTTYSWANNNTSIGLAASGTGNINPFTVINNGTSPVTATVIVTPSANACGGLPIIFTITVNPTPSINIVSNQVVCNGDNTSASTFSSPVAGTTYTWTNSTPYIGLAGSGTGDISSFVAFNGINIPVIGTIIVTPSANGCLGPVTSFNITVTPTPTTNPVSNQTVCNGSPTTAVTFAGGASGTAFNWTNSNPSIGLAASGINTVPSFNGVNITNFPVTASISTSPSANGCTGATSTFTITVNPTPTVTSLPNQTVCNGTLTAPINITGPLSGSTFSWTNSNTSIGLAASGSGNIGAFVGLNAGAAPVTATITVIPTANGCTGTPSTFTITVNPTPAANAVSNQTLCNGDNTAAVTFSGPVTGTIYSWSNNNTSIGLAANGAGNIASFPATNSGSTIVTATITVTPNANACTGTPITFTITVNPTPVANAIPNQTLCNGDPTAPILFTGPVAGTIYNWTNTNPTIGLAASGSGDITAFSATNASSAPITATITATPVANGCTGLPISFTITINPTPTVNAVSNQNICNTAATTAVTFTGNVSGTLFSWANSNTTIGLGASGTGNIGSFTATNSTPDPTVGTITVTPSANGCTGAPITFTITVQPTATVNTVPNQAVCNGDNTATVTFSGSTTGATYSWTNDTPSIGLAASGTGNIASFTAVNAGTAPVIATITVTAISGGCPGVPVTFIFIINPTPTANTVSNQTLCETTSTADINFTSPTTGTTYAWTNSNPSIGLAASGTGNIPSFVTNDTSSSPITSTITVTPTANGCVGTTSSFTITVNPNPQANAGPVMSMPCNGMVTLDGSASQSGPNITYTWSASPGNVLAYGTTVHPVANQLGIYTITVTNTTTGCFSTDTTSVIGSMPPIASFTTTPDPAVGFVPLNVAFTNTSLNASTYQWVFGDGNTATTADASDFYIHSGTYTVYLIVTNSSGCIDTAETEVVVHDTYSIIFPTIFTPNDDGTNDVYSPIVKGVVKLHAEIFDRWGLKLYEWNSIGGGWDGYTTSGQKSAQGTYFYIIQTTDVQGQDHTDQGSFMLIK